MTVLALALWLAAAPPPPLTIAGDAFWVHERSQPAPVGDAVLVNFEGGVCGPDVRPGGRRDRKTGRWRLCMPATAPAWLRTVGVVAVGHENNHAEDGTRDDTRFAFRSLPIDRLAYGRPWRRPPYRVWVLSAGSPSLDARIGYTAARAAAARDDPTVAYVHRGTGHGTAALDRLARAGVPVVIGVGHHEAGAIRRVGGSWVFDDLGDLVVDCACSRGRYGLLVDLPGVPGEHIVVRLVRAAHGPKDEVGARVAPAIAERVLGRLSAGQPGARVVDGRLELLWPEPPASELQRPVGEPAP